MPERFDSRGLDGGPDRRARRRRAAAALGVAAIFAVWSFSRAWTNLRVVDPGRFYRSGQLSDAQLRRALETHGIATVINLRGADPDAAWYAAEAAVTREQGVALVDVELRAGRLPHREELIALLDAIRDAERPILVHCFSGADRAGIASAIYQVDEMGRSSEEALAMLTPWYLHFAWWTPAPRHFVERYEGERWARSSYDPCREPSRHYDRDRYCR